MFLLSLFLLGMLNPAIDQPSAPSPLWSWDVLVWDMSGPSTSIGPGHDYLESALTPDQNMVVCSVVDSDVDSLELFAAEGGGESWFRKLLLTSSWSFTDPEIYFTTGPPDNLLLFLAANSGEFMGLILGVKLTLPELEVAGITEIPWNQAGADTLRSITAVWDAESGTHRLFADDKDGNLFGASSADGIVWSDLELIRTNASRPVAVAGPGERIYLAYQETVIGDIHCAVLSSEGITDTSIGDGAPDAHPSPACEWTGGQNVAVAWHNAAGEVVMAVSDDSGATWDSPTVVGEGSYPVLAVESDGSDCSMAFIDAATGLVMVSAASSLNALRSEPGVVRGGMPACAFCPPALDQGVLPSDQILFYLGEGGEDIWFDGTLYTGMPSEEWGGAVPSLSVSPNPSSGAFRVDFSVPQDWADVSVSLYTLDGRLAALLVDGAGAAGSLEFGDPLPAGVYLLKLESPSGSVTGRLVRI